MQRGPAPRAPGWRLPCTGHAAAAVPQSAVRAVADRDTACARFVRLRESSVSSTVQRRHARGNAPPDHLWGAKAPEPQPTRRQARGAGPPASSERRPGPAWANRSLNLQLPSASGCLSLRCALSFCLSLYAVSHEARHEEREFYGRYRRYAGSHPEPAAYRSSTAERGQRHRPHSATWSVAAPRLAWRLATLAWRRRDVAIPPSSSDGAHQ